MNRRRQWWQSVRTKTPGAVFPPLLLAVAAAFAYGRAGIAAGVTEPVALLLSGSLMLSLAGALRRRLH